jgi:predicted nucleotidyltransferase
MSTKNRTKRSKKFTYHFINIFVLKVEHMILKKEQFCIESLASKTTFKVLRLFIERPYLSFSLSDISRNTHISKSNVSRALNVLGKSGIIRIARGGKRKLFKIDSGKGITKAFSNLLMQERKSNLKSKTKNAVDFLFSEIGDKVEGFILFGSCAYGLETEKSDIDILVLNTKNINISSAEFLPFKFEIHSKTWKEAEQLDDFLVLDAILNGIFFKGSKKLFMIKAGIESFPKEYLLFRMKKIKEFEERIRRTSGEAKKYYKGLLNVSLGELESLLYEGRIVPKKRAKPKRNIKEIEERLANEGERIWLKKT